MSDLRNSNEDALKRERIALRGKIKRREDAILLATADIREYRDRLRRVEHELAEYKRPKP